VLRRLRRLMTSSTIDGAAARREREKKHANPIADSKYDFRTTTQSQARSEAAGRIAICGAIDTCVIRPNSRGFGASGANLQPFRFVANSHFLVHSFSILSDILTYVTKWRISPPRLLGMLCSLALAISNQYQTYRLPSHSILLRQSNVINKTNPSRLNCVGNRTTCRQAKSPTTIQTPMTQFSVLYVSEFSCVVVIFPVLSIVERTVDHSK